MQKWQNVEFVYSEHGIYLMMLFGNVFIHHAAPRLPGRAHDPDPLFLSPSCPFPSSSLVSRPIFLRPSSRHARNIVRNQGAICVTTKIIAREAAGRLSSAYFLSLLPEPCERGRSGWSAAHLLTFIINRALGWVHKCRGTDPPRMKISFNLGSKWAFATELVGNAPTGRGGFG